ncbi:fructosamine kinase family protein [Halobacillus salinus]|uniref:Fructosamine kinase n=1 Tax=Halobacillus salinus TaxID=192814 RepID=A0A4Z0GZ31_9BACI|nr:fructosamine kinase family protein [Halobacillus salinus]TGB02655.1 fructosamine kinase [Halobacillus salinus]
MRDKIQEALHTIGDRTNIQDWKAVGGGDINRSFYVKTDQQEYFIKGNENVPSHFFKAEAEGLKQIEQTDSIAVPHVYHYDEPQKKEQAVIVMDWVPLGSKDVSEELGHQLALMHQHTKDGYGFHAPTFVGELDQPNSKKDSWLVYYRDYRLKAQLEYGKQNGLITGDRESRLQMLLDQLHNWIPENPGASLLHGDLWGGNWMAGADGKPYLIDPSVLYGDRAFELAFTELFGGFSSRFYEAYQEVSPLPDEYEQQKPLYQLFYLLVHLNMFGESYGPSVDRILKAYTSN